MYINVNVNSNHYTGDDIIDPFHCSVMWIEKRCKHLPVEKIIEDIH